MSSAFLVNIQDRRDNAKAAADGKRHVPGVPDAPVIATARGTTRFLGREDSDAGPFVYYSERPAGDIIPMHRHNANRIEFLIDGRIEWREPGKPPVEYGAGTMSHVEAGIVYGYTVLEDAKILIIFDKAPGINLV